MAKLLKKPEDSKEYAPTFGKTLATIAEKEAADWVKWTHIAQLNWGTTEPDEVVRAMAETVGIRIDGVFDKNGKLKVKPEQVKFDPDKDLPDKKIRIPEALDAAELNMEQRHTLKIKKTLPAVAVSIRNLDPWFIPEVEECEIDYAFHGLKDAADKAKLDVYATNYARCTDFADGTGKFVHETAYDKLPIFSDDTKVKPVERGKGAFKWKGEVTTDVGVLGQKRADQDKRHINVAFSPYTAHMRYWKSNTERKAQLQLHPFWPKFDRTETVVNPTPAWKPSEPAATSVELSYDLPDDAEGGWIIAKDASGQVVWRKILTKDELKKGNGKKVTWDGTYDKLALNGLMKNKLLNDSAVSNSDIRTKGYLFRSWPYTFEMKTYVTKYRTGVKNGEPDPALIKWKIHETSVLKKGLILVFDKNNQLVWIKGLAEAKLTKDTDHEIQWDGKYATGVKNSEGEEKAIAADMPYRAQIQAHTPENAAEGVALAAMHSEVRLYVPQEQFAPKDPRRDLIETPPAMQISRASFWPRSTPPAAAHGNTDDARLYFQHDLHRAGYPAGPLSGETNDHFERAVREFKRSVPKDVTAAAGSFARHSLDPANIDTLTSDMKDCLGSGNLGPRWKRNMWGERAKIDANNHGPYYSDDKNVDKTLADPSKDIVLWVDNRDTYTRMAGPGGAFHGYGPDGVDMLGNLQATVAPPPGAAAIQKQLDHNLRNYRGGMAIGDTAVDHDKTNLLEPWAPLKAELRLLKKGEDLYPEHDKKHVEIASGGAKDAIARAIGPIRVDWSVHDALYDVSTIDPAQYPAGINPTTQANDASVHEFRTRRYVAGALRDASVTHTRMDEAFAARYWNCKKANHTVGKLPATMAQYHREVFAEGKKDSLKPWMAIHDNAQEATATIVHDHVAEIKGADVPKNGVQHQKVDQNLFPALQGSAGVWFNPAITAGDGYRLRAEVKFEEAGDYKFPNLKTLKARYAVAPQASTCEIRIWRRSSMRGYCNWSDAAGANATRWTNNTLQRIRHQYKMGHVYHVLEGTETLATGEKNLQVLLGNFAQNATKQIMRNFATWHNALNWDPTVGNVDLNANFLWPWAHRTDVGRPQPRQYPGATTWGAAYGDYVGAYDLHWDKLTGAVLYWIHQAFEDHGFLRGHMMIDFKDCDNVQVWGHQCPTAGHPKLMEARRGGGSPPVRNCPTCGTAMGQATLGGALNSIGLASIGLAVGSSWMAKANVDDFVHEMGHHRHMEHASSAPGPKAAQHDSGANADVPPGATVIDGTAGVGNALERQWDRRCVMSYNDRDAQRQVAAAGWNKDRPTLIFCGKCAMRIRGWKFAHVSSPANDVHEPL